MRFAPFMILLATTSLAAQQPPGPTDLPSKPFFVKSTWIIGGSGGWDSLTMDAQSHRLFIAHGATVQVVDTETGQLAGAVGHLGEAHAIALDTNGQIGYISDGRANQIKIFDRSTLEVVASVPVGSSPRALVLEPQTEMLFVFGAEQVGAQPGNPGTTGPSGGRSSNPTPSNNRNAAPGPCGIRNGDSVQQSLVSIIDTEKRSRIAEIEICGAVAGAAADGDGQVYFNLSSLDEIARVSATDILELVKDRLSNAKPAANGAASADRYVVIDWRSATAQRTLHKASPNPQLTLIGVASDCREPTGLTIDTHNQQLFASCKNQKMVVVDAGSGNLVTSIPIGAGAEEIAYDSERNLLFSANGAGTGTLTVIRQTIPDSYAVVQTLPTRANARTAVVDPATGRVYVVTVLSGMKVDNPPANGIGKLNINPIESSFQVLVIGN